MDPDPGQRPVEVRPADGPPPSEGWSGPGSEAERLVRSASAGRLVLRIGIAGVVVVALAVGGWLGLDRWRERQAKNVRMVHVPSATVEIGSRAGPPEERPVHAVSIAAFDLDATEVTVAAYGACVKRGACTVPAKGDFCNWGKEDTAKHPINCVDWQQARAYCAWAGKRLPSEKEWEYAARGTDARRFPWGAERPGPKLCNVCGAECRLFGAHKNRAWNAMHDFDDGWPLTAPVGSFPRGRSALGLEDMGGNVWEWTSSPFCSYPDETCGNEEEYVMRGGSWTNAYASNMEATTRQAIGKKEAVEALGFRCAR